MLHKLCNKIKANSKSVYSNIGGGSHGHLCLVLNYAQYALISPTPFVYQTHPGPLIVPDGTTAHVNSNIRIAYTKEVRLFREVTGLEQSPVQKKFNGQRGIFIRYMQKDHKLHQQHRGGRTCAFTKQLRSVDVARAPGMGGHCQEEDLQPTGPNCNLVLSSQVTPLVL